MNIVHALRHQTRGLQALHCLTGFYAVCRTCRKRHYIAPGEAMGTQPWLDWLAKHPAPWHETALVEDSDDLVNDYAHNADAKVAYVATGTYTITLTGLATSSTLLAGREGTAVSNASNKYIDELVAGQVMVGTTPTANTQIEVHAVGALDDTPTWPETFTGSDAAATIGDVVGDGAGIKPGICRPIALLSCQATTSNVPHPFSMMGIRQLFGDAMPVQHLPFVTHSTAVNLNATATNHFIKHTPVYATVT